MTRKVRKIDKRKGSRNDSIPVHDPRNVRAGLQNNVNDKAKEAGPHNFKDKMGRFFKPWVL